MNRLTLTVIKQSTTLPLDSLTQITQCSPYSQGWLSEKFPLYPITINFHIDNPPFNRISIKVEKEYRPSAIVFQGSADCREYFRVCEIKEFEQTSNIIVINLKQSHHYKYIRLKIKQPPLTPLRNHTSRTNICRQIWIRCLQLTYVTFYNTEYVCSMQKALELDPCLFRLLELLEYKALLAKDKSKMNGGNAEEYRQASARYYKDIKDILDKVKSWKENTKKLSLQARKNIMQQIQCLAKQPLDPITIKDIEYNRQAIKNQVSMLQSQLADFYIHRLNSLHKDVTDYFHKYWNKQVKQQYMRLLSSPQHEDHGKALSKFWSEVKQLKQFPQPIQQAVVMYFNYFLEYVHDPLKIVAIKILCMLFKGIGADFGKGIYFVYERLLFNLYSQLSDQTKQELIEVSLKCIYILFQKVPDNLYIQSLLNPQHSVKLRMKLIKLQILQKLTYKSITVDPPQKDMIINYLLDILSIKQITLQDKNRAYNIIAYLATVYGKQAIMYQFEKLNTMITMSMEKIVDKKMQLIKVPKKEDDIPSCQYCGIVRQAFKDTNVYDLHCFKQCKYLTPCKYCSQVIQIPELNKHYIQNCQQRNIFKECEDCNEVIIKINEQEHQKVCPKSLTTTKCGLCGEKVGTYFKRWMPKQSKMNYRRSS